MSELATFTDHDSVQLAQKHWYVIYSKPRQERVATDNLSRQGYETYLPMIEISKRKQGAVIKKAEPFFPRYLFIRLDMKQDNWSPIRSTRGVVSLVRFNGNPKSVPESLIRALKNNENSHKLQSVTPKYWKKGDALEIEQGPFAGYRCIFQGTRSSDRVTVLLNIVGKLSQTTIHRNDLQLPQSA